MFDFNGLAIDIPFYSRAGAFLLICVLSIFAAASRIIKCASDDKTSTVTIWTAALIVFVFGFVFVAGMLRLLPQPEMHWLQ